MSQRAEAKTLHAARLDIGPRLILGFAIIILAMLAADAVVLWQFRVVNTHAGRLNDIDQKLIAVLRARTSLHVFNDRLNALADSEDAEQLVKEAGPLRADVLDDIHAAASVLSVLPTDLRRDPTILLTLEILQSALPSQLDAITTLAISGDWRAVRLRLTNQIRPLDSLTSALVEKVEREVGEERSQTVLDMERVQRRVLFIVPVTAVIALAIAVVLGLAITRSITHPLARLVEGSRALARGEFEHRVVIGGDDELARLGQVFNDTAHRLRDLYATLRVSEERWRNLVEGAPVGIALTDVHGHYVATNPALQRMMGYSETELRGLSAIDLTHEDDRVMTEAMIEGTAAGKPPSRVNKRYRHRDGTVIWAEVSGFPVPVEGSTPLLAGIVVDITERKRAEDELKRSEAALAEAQQISHTGSWRWKIATGEVAVSAELGRMLRLDPAMPLPSAEAFIAMVHADDRPAFQEVLERAIRERSRVEHEYRQGLSDGSIKRLHLVGRPDVALTGELEYTGVVMDVTERRHAEEALRDAQAELTRAARLTTMGELAASLSHELRQPLAAIVMNGSATLRWLDRHPPDLGEAREAATRIVREGQRADEVIRGLRALATKSELQLTTLDIDDVVREVLALTRGELHRHGVALRTELTADRAVVGDRVQLQQVLLNLILNGIDAMGAVAPRTRELTVSSSFADPDSVCVSVEDTGPGLDPAIAPRIFDPFFTTKADGLGMGLSICRSIVDVHGGKLWASPRVPHGTALHFTVPVSADQV